MDWLFSIVRIAGASFPGASSLVHMHSEIESKALLGRVNKLEDPISCLHDDVPELSRKLYQELKRTKSTHLKFDPDFYGRYSRALAALESQEYLKGLHSLGNPYYGGVHLTDPSYIMYLCALEENPEEMQQLVDSVDKCEVGQWLDGAEISPELPMPVKQAVFDIYESKGYGLCSKTIGACQYCGIA